jgi:anti-anti-sigma factor
LELRVVDFPGGKTILLSGRMTFADHNAMRTLFRLFEDPGVKTCIFDLSGVDFIDSAALGMLLLARETAIGRSIRIVLKGAKDRVQRVMEIARFGELFAVEA